MPADRYMALEDLQTVWTNKMKPYVQQTYATKSEVAAATVAEAHSAAAEITFEETT